MTVLAKIEIEGGMTQMNGQKSAQCDIIKLSAYLRKLEAEAAKFLDRRQFANSLNSFVEVELNPTLKTRDRFAPRLKFAVTLPNRQSMIQLAQRPYQAYNDANVMQLGAGLLATRAGRRRRLQSFAERCIRTIRFLRGPHGPGHIWFYIAQDNVDAADIRNSSMPIVAPVSQTGGHAAMDGGAKNCHHVCGVFLSDATSSFYASAWKTGIV